MNKLDPTRPVQTRDGRPARILATDIKRDDGLTLAVASGYRNAPDEEYLGMRHPNGRVTLAYEHDDDIINVAVKRTKLVYLYESDKGYDVVSLAPPELRRRFVNANPIAAKFVEFVEGEFE